MLTSAGLAIVVCGDMELEQGSGFWVQDCSAATMNILLAAHALGLGSVWLGVHPKTDLKNNVRNLLEIPRNIEPFGIISIGYPAVEKPASMRYDEKRVHNEKW
jgi:nitroreductase